MYSLSTSWNSSRHRNGFDIIKEIKDIGFDTVELDWSLTEDVIRDIISLKESGQIKISSLHNMCPIPSGIEARRASPDYYSLASLNEEDRALALKAAKNTVTYAKRFNAKAVVLHTGRIKMRERIRELDAAFGDKRNFAKVREAMVEERERNKCGYLDKVIASLDELVRYAGEAGIPLAVENRYYYSEIPSLSEFEIIFKTFKPGALYYWHDVGHAEVFDRLGLASHKDFLNKFSDRLIGVHLHDIIGLITDHNPPGFGDFDFTILRPYLRDGIIRVIEAHEPASAEQLRQALRYLERVLG